MFNVILEHSQMMKELVNSVLLERILQTLDQHIVLIVDVEEKRVLIELLVTYVMLVIILILADHVNNVKLIQFLQNLDLVYVIYVQQEQKQVLIKLFVIFAMLDITLLVTLHVFDVR